MTPGGDGIARRFEAKHLQLALALSIESLRFGPERAAAFGGSGGYSNRVTGSDLTPDDIDAAIIFFTERGEDTKLELTSFATPELLDAIGARGFHLRRFTHILARTPGPNDSPALERLDRSNADLVHAVALHNERCFAPEGEPVSALAVALTERNLRLPTNDTVIVRANEEIVGVGCSESSHGLTLLFGGAVKPDARGHGIQRALMSARLAIAAERGSDLVCVMTGPGTSSERNALRAGFTPAYTRAFFTRPR